MSAVLNNEDLSVTAPADAAAVSEKKLEKIYTDKSPL